MQAEIPTAADVDAEPDDLASEEMIDANRFAESTALDSTLIYSLIRRGVIRAFRHPLVQKVLIPKSELVRFKAELVPVNGAIRGARKAKCATKRVAK